MLKILLGLRRNVSERNQEKRRRSLETRAHHLGGTDVRRAMIAGISLSIPNPNTIARELKFSNPALQMKVDSDINYQATLASQRAQFTWALHQYNSTEDPAQRGFYARQIARYIAAAPANHLTVEQITQGQNYPEEVAKYLNQADSDTEPDVSEQQAIREIEQMVDASDVVRLGEGSGFVYAYGYACAPDRLKVGMTATDTVQRIAAQIGAGTPDKPLLKLEIKTEDPLKLAGAIHAVLDYRGRHVMGGGKGWVLISRDELIAIYEFIADAVATKAQTNSKP